MKPRRATRFLLSLGIVLALLMSPMTPGLAADSADESGSRPPSVDARVLGRIVAEDILLRSGAGITMQPSTDLIETVTGQSPADRVLPPGAALLEAVYAGADDSTSWADAEFDRTITPAGQAAATIAGLRLAATLIGTGDADEAATAQLHVMTAKAQADFALVNLMTTDGDLIALVDDVSEPVSPAHTSILLRGLSELSLATSEGLQFEDPLFNPWFKSGATLVHEMLGDAAPGSLSETAHTVRALTSYAALDTADSTDVEAEIQSLIGSMSQPSTAMDKASAIRALIAAHQATGDQSHLSAAEETFVSLVSDLDLDDGAIAGTEQLTIWEIADLIGALGDATSIDAVSTEAAITAEAMVTRLIVDSGLMPVALNQSDDVRRTFGSAIGFDPGAGGWTVADASVDIVGALYAAGELLAMPIAPAGDTAGETAESTAAPSTQPTVVIESTEFGFSPSTVALTQGEEIVLRLVNNGLVEHNIDIPSLGVLLTAAPGETAESILVVPGSENGGSFTCSLAGHAEAGMTGTVQIGLAVAESPDAETQVVAARIEMDETTGMPSLTTAIILAMGMFLAMMAFVIGMLQFTKGFEEQQ